MPHLRWFGLLAAASSLSSQAVPRTLLITRELRIEGAREGLTVISSFAVMPNGGIVVGQAQDYQVRFFDSKGGAGARFGRKGAGPGEFESMGKIGRLADTLWINDQRLYRTTYLTTSGKLIRTNQWPSGLRASPSDSGTWSSVGGLSPQAVFPNGEFLHHFLLSRNVRPSERLKDPEWLAGADGRFPLVRLDRDGHFLKLVAWMPLSDVSCSKRFQEGGFAANVIIPFCAYGLNSVSADGQRVVNVLQHDLQAVSSPGSYRVIVIGTKGDTIVSREIRYTPVPVSRQENDSVLARMKKDANPVVLGAIKLLPPPPPTHPPIRKIVAGLDGTIWLSVMTRDPGEEWLLLDAKGVALGRVKLPPRTTLKEGSRSKIWVMELDSDDLPSVVRYRVGS